MLSVCQKEKGPALDLEDIGPGELSRTFKVSIRPQLVFHRMCAMLMRHMSRTRGVGFCTVASPFVREAAPMYLYEGRGEGTRMGQRVLVRVLTFCLPRRQKHLGLAGDWVPEVATD